MTTNQVRTVDTKTVRTIWDRALSNWMETMPPVDDLRTTYRAKHGLAHKERAEADYRGRLAVEECKIRIAAFDNMVDLLSHSAHTTDSNMLLPMIRRAGIKIRHGDVEVDHVLVPVFKLTTWRLWPEEQAAA